MSTIYGILNHPVSEGKKIRIMPDVHDGAGIVIGFTMPIGEMVNPEHIGVDIGCSVLMAKVSDIDMPLEEIDKKIRESIPMGFSHRSESPFGRYIPDKLKGIEPLCNKMGLELGDVMRQLGTLGGGNHYIEIGRAEKTNEMWVSIHTGSRNFGLQVCKYHKNKAKNKSMPYLTGNDMLEYFEDMKIAQAFASLNRLIIWQDIAAAIGAINKTRLVFETMHNYIDFKRGIIRKGAVSAEKGELLAIPMNMRDGVLLCMGKGNEDWNYSAPHGAGRIMSRSAAKKSVTLEEFSDSMKGVFSTSVNEATIDESPFAYKDMSVIMENISDTVDIIDIIKPVLNIKA